MSRTSSHIIQQPQRPGNPHTTRPASSKRRPALLAAPAPPHSSRPPSAPLHPPAPAPRAPPYSLEGFVQERTSPPARPSIRARPPGPRPRVERARAEPRPDLLRPRRQYQPHRRLLPRSLLPRPHRLACGPGRAGKYPEAEGLRGQEGGDRLRQLALRRAESHRRGTESHRSHHRSEPSQGDKALCQLAPVLSSPLCWGVS